VPEEPQGTNDANGAAPEDPKAAEPS
jgi:hypothetical protein